ncbi:5-(carboxyamino)imidazole ribonucleotide synthase, partial [Candidatus Uhrbacteria bacterium]|nr:5-(carboxyamino)imidazole ribonucleotide synthase [Candidatus Uhrbacteria bacterium]
GLMLTEAAHFIGIRTAVLDPSPLAPALEVCDYAVVGQLHDEQAVRALLRYATHLTYEIEAPDVGVLRKYAAVVAVHPNPETLSITQDKLFQKQFLEALKIPTAAFGRTDTESDIKDFFSLHGPCVVKLRKHGYDGRGNQIVETAHQIARAAKKFASKEYYCEKLVPFRRELAIQIGRSSDGRIIYFPIVETVQINGICHIVRAPARLSPSKTRIVHEISRKVAESFAHVGMIAIEFFESKDGGILVNELAPRVHNSGHHTIESCTISQFEEHVRLVCGLAPKQPRMKKQAIMLNIIGKKNEKAKIGFADSEKMRNTIFIHIYGKIQNRIGRKMGHITAIGSNHKSLEKKVALTRQSIPL